MFRALVSCVVLTASLAAQCSSASCFGPPGTDPVVISGAWQIASGAVLDFGSRHVILATGSSLILNGPASILAAKVTAQTGSIIDGTAVPASDLTVTTAPAGPHDGAATLNGFIDLSGWPPGSTFGQNAGSFTLTAGGVVSLAGLDVTSGFSATAGNVTITAPAISVGTIVADALDYYSSGSNIQLTSTGPVVVGSIHAQTNEYSVNSQVHVVGSSYTQVTGIDTSPYGGGVNSYPGWITVAVTGIAAINGAMLTSGAGHAAGGTIQVTAGDALTWVNAVAEASGSFGGTIDLRSLNADVVVQGTLLARSENCWGNQGGYVALEAAGNVDFTGTADVSSDQLQPNPHGEARLVAKKQLTIHAGSLLDARDPLGGCTGIGGVIHLAGCRVVVENGAAAHTCGSYPAMWPVISIEVGNSMTMDGIVSAGAPSGPGQIDLHSRRPWGYTFSGSGTFTPAPMITIDPGLPPCTGDLTSVTATTPALAGQVVTVSVSSVPNKPLIVVANTPQSHLSLGVYGWTQVDVFTGYVFADHLGILGPAIPGMTDAAGQWTSSITTPVTPLLSNVAVWYDVYVIDPSSPNGLFRQPPAAATYFL